MRRTRGKRPPLKIPEAAHELNASDWQVRQEILHGRLDAFRVGRQWRITPESVDRLKAGQAGEEA